MQQHEADIYIGLMSGTSLDAIDVAAVSFEPAFVLHASHTTEIPATLKAQIIQLTLPGNNEIDLMGQVHHALGGLFAHAVNKLIKDNSLPLARITAIGSHGQTIRHRPEFGFTLQIGDASLIAEKTGITTVADFRSRDMAAGGQGAPLVPAFHEALFRSEVEDRILLNIGGMANLTFLPADPASPIQGFDTGPGNILLDSWIQQHTDKNYDEDGNWAASGTCQPDLLASLLSLPYFTEPPPKSTGREQFNLEWLQTHIDKQACNYSAEDIQATLLELTAITCCQSIQEHISSSGFSLYICGGGSHNTALVNRIAEQLNPHKVSNTLELGLPADWVESAAFAWLAYRCIKQESGNLPSVTGAHAPRILGAIYHA